MDKKNYGTLTNDQASYLLQLPKKILHNKEVADELSLDQIFPLNLRFELLSPDDDEFTFLWEINQSKKNTIRISLHVQDNDSSVGLLRVDFNGGHKNPETILDSLPERFHPYVGKEFSNNEHHIHYHTEGYKSLAWAIPLTNDPFQIKEIDNTDFNNKFINTIRLFARTINLQTEMKINPLLL